MARFFLSRIGFAFLSIWAVCTITFFVAQLAPGDPAKLYAGEKASSDPLALARARHALGLDRPLPVRYCLYLWDAAHGDLGRSYEMDREPVTAFLGRCLPATALLAGCAICLALVFGLLTGAAAALHPNSLLDRFLMALVLTGVTLPNFVLAPVLILVFCVRLGWLPVPGGLEWGDPQLLVLPSIVLCLRPAALIARMTRSSLVETLRQDYIRTARAKGLTRSRILWKHGLKNAFLPVLSTVGVSFGYLLSGSFVVETIFAVPGVGFASINAVTTENYPLIEGTALLLAVIFVVINLITDLLYGLLDPRVKAGA